MPNGWALSNLKLVFVSKYAAMECSNSRVVSRGHPNNISSLEHGLEPDTFLPNIAFGFRFSLLRALTNSTQRLDISGREAHFIAINSQTAFLVRELEARVCPAGVCVVVGILDDFEQEMCRALIELVGEAGFGQKFISNEY